jgi:hypothetical protein
VYLTNDELTTLSRITVNLDPLFEVEQRRACGLRAIIKALAMDLLAMRQVTGVDASRVGAPQPASEPTPRRRR